MTTRIERHLLNGAATWTVLGLLSGLGYREFTRTVGYTGFTQLALAHTHALMLGTAVLLIVLTLNGVFGLWADHRMGLFLGFWNAGLGLTVGMLALKGSLQVLGSEVATSKALAGVAGLGHILLSGSFVLLFLILRRALRGEQAPRMTDEAARASLT